MVQAVVVVLVVTLAAEAMVQALLTTVVSLRQDQVAVVVALLITVPMAVVEAVSESLVKVLTGLPELLAGRFRAGAALVVHQVV
jgi:hypothetical protein